MVHTIGNEQEIVHLIDTFQGLVVIDVFASWCGPCKVLAPKLEIMESEFPNVKFIKVDVDEVSNFADKNDIAAMPTILFIKQGTEVARIVGINEQNIRDMIKKYM